MKSNNKLKGSTVLWLIVSIVVLIGGGYLFLNNGSSSLPSTSRSNLAGYTHIADNCDLADFSEVSQMNGAGEAIQSFTVIDGKLIQNKLDFTSMIMPLICDKASIGYLNEYLQKFDANTDGKWYTATEQGVSFEVKASIAKEDNGDVLTIEKRQVVDGQVSTLENKLILSSGLRTSVLIDYFPGSDTMTSKDIRDVVDYNDKVMIFRYR